MRALVIYRRSSSGYSADCVAFRRGVDLVASLLVDLGFCRTGSGSQSHQVLVFPGRPVATTFWNLTFCCGCVVCCVVPLLLFSQQAPSPTWHSRLGRQMGSRPVPTSVRKVNCLPGTSGLPRASGPVARDDFPTHTASVAAGLADRWIGHAVASRLQVSGNMPLEMRIRFHLNQ
jgi:hypothetical protein